MDIYFPAKNIRLSPSPSFPVHVVSSTNYIFIWPEEVIDIQFNTTFECLSTATFALRKV